MKRKISKKAYFDLRTVLVEILTNVCSLDEDGNEAISELFLCSQKFYYVSQLTGEVAWSKLLDIFFNVIYECLDGRAEQFM